MSEPNIPDSPALELLGGKPRGVWVALVAIGVVTVLQLISAVSRHSGSAFVAAVCDVALMTGLARGDKWAYLLLIVFSIGGAVFAFGKSAQAGLTVLLGNAVVLVPILISTRFFFPPPKISNTRQILKLFHEGQLNEVL